MSDIRNSRGWSLTISYFRGFLFVGTTMYTGSMSRRFPVETVTVDRACVQRRAPMTGAEFAPYMAEGLSRAEAAKLHAVGVPADEFWEWKKALGLPADPIPRIVNLAKQGASRKDVETFPHMPDIELVTLLARGVTAKEAHAYGHALGWCCGRSTPDSAIVRMSWFTIPRLVELGVTVNQVEELLVAHPQVVLNASTVTEIFEMRIPVSMTVWYREKWRDMNSVLPLRTEWRRWVEAADGRVRVAEAVAVGGGRLTDVRDWLASGESPDRIASLVRAGATPGVVSQDGYEDLTDEDLEVWAVLNRTAEGSP